MKTHVNCLQEWLIFHHFIAANFKLIGREEACRLLMELDAPAGVYDDTGTTCLTHMIEKMPSVAKDALEQFQKVDKASRTVRYYLSYLETEKWNMLKKKRTGGGWRVLTKREPLEVCLYFYFILYSFYFFFFFTYP